MHLRIEATTEKSLREAGEGGKATGSVWSHRLHCAQQRAARRSGGMDSDRILEHERLQMEQIRQLDMEELLVEEVDSDTSSDGDWPAFTRREFEKHQMKFDYVEDSRFSDFTRVCGRRGACPVDGFTYNTYLASMHSYLGEVDNSHGRLFFLDGGAILNLPMFYLEGVVLFPEATLPLRVLQPQFIAAVERALNQSDAPCTIGVVRVHQNPDDRKLCFASTGTTAEIRQYRRLDDGSMNIVARGQQRFRLRRHWVDADGAPCGEVQIVREDAPLRTPKEAFARFASFSNFQGRSSPCVTPSSLSHVKWHGHDDTENSWDSVSHGSITSDHSADYRVLVSPSDSTDSYSVYGRFNEPLTDEELIHRKDGRAKKPFQKVLVGFDQSCEYGLDCSPVKSSDSCEIWKRSIAFNESRRHFYSSMAFLPYWVYQMHDSFSLAQRAADLWRKIIGNPSLDDYVRKPDLLSFYIASKLPMSEATRQELLEIDGISYRLRREIELLNGFNLVRCKNCQTLIATRSDMLVMSSDGPLNAYVNPHGFVHEIITVNNASGLSFYGNPVKEHSWFPGYAWSIASCASCGSNMGWLFSATKRNLLPKSFWGIRSAAVVDDTPR